MDTLRLLDILGFVIGLIYLVLEYRASIWLWLASIVMPAVDMVLYFKAGLYADFGMAIYYCLAAVYGYLVWKWPGLLRRRSRLCEASGKKSPDQASEGLPTESRAVTLQTASMAHPKTERNAHPEPDSKAQRESLPITHFPKSRILPVAGIFALLWLGLWALLSYATNSTVPVTDAFTTALSIIALWALAHKYAEQWLLWLVVDLVCTALYLYKGIPFKAAIYGLYTLFAVFGYRKWLQKMRENLVF